LRDYSRRNPRDSNDRVIIGESVGDPEKSFPLFQESFNRQVLESLPRNIGFIEKYVTFLPSRDISQYSTPLSAPRSFFSSKYANERTLNAKLISFHFALIDLAVENCRNLNDWNYEERSFKISIPADRNIKLDMKYRHCQLSRSAMNFPNDSIHTFYIENSSSMHGFSRDKLTSRALRHAHYDGIDIPIARYSSLPEIRAAYRRCGNASSLITRDINGKSN